MLPNFYLWIKASCKWRHKLVTRRRKLELKALDLIIEINAKRPAETEPVTIDHFNSGVFPWDLASKGDLFKR